jgi:hypothetical protein
MIKETQKSSLTINSYWAITRDKNIVQYTVSIICSNCPFIIEKFENYENKNKNNRKKISL